MLACTALTSCTTPLDTDHAQASSQAAANSRLAEPETIAGGLDVPWSIAFHEGTTLISERDSARIVELDQDGNTREVGTVGGVEGDGEGGLLGITVKDGYLFAYSTGAGENRIGRYKLTGSAGSLELSSREKILDGIPSAGIHNGGRIAFGPDGMLYATAGDAGNTDNAQDLDSLGGKILRMTAEGAVPEGNPFPDSLVYSYGHRNPQGIAWATDDTMYASEFGQSTWDELNIIEAGSNYGWPEVEGIAEQDGYVDPVQQWEPSEASPSGIAVTDGAIFIANLRGERLREVPLSDPSTSTEHFVGEYGRLRDVTVAPDGAVWMLTNNTDGRGDPAPEDDRLLSIDLD
ncbi:PQQ-dependent sugar dehydrogenase [Arthrobacter roseus]